MINYILALFPSVIHVPIRRLMGARIQKGAIIRIGSVIKTKDLEIKTNVTIGPFCYLCGDSIFIDESAHVKSFSIVSARKIVMGKYVHIAPLAVISGNHTPRSVFEIGDHSRVFPFCWLETGEGIIIGKHVGIGGHTLIFTHGVWSDYLDGGPVTYAGVEIEDDVWLPWRVFIMPGVRIGKGSIIGANSLVNKNVPSNVVAAGSPAKVIIENVISEPDQNEKLLRIQRILKDFADYSPETWIINHDGISNNIFSIKYLLNETNVEKRCLYILANADETSITMLKKHGISFIVHAQKTFYYNQSVKEFERFVFFLRRFGIRLYKVKY